MSDEENYDHPLDKPTNQCFIIPTRYVKEHNSESS